MKIASEGQLGEPLNIRYPTIDAPNKVREAELRRLQVTDRLPSYGIIFDSH